MSTLYDKAVYVDWKSKNEDIIYALREGFREEYPFILQQNFDELAENYATEEPEAFLDALGQELTCYGGLLYELKSQSDEYSLIIIPAEAEEAFKAQLKSDRSKGTPRKQARRKAGTPAKRIDLGKRLPVERYTLEQGCRINLVAECLDGKLLLDYESWSEPRHFCSALLNINEWKPKQSKDMKLIVERLALNKNGIYAAMVQNNEINQQGYLANPNNKVLIGSDINNIELWQCIYEGEKLEWSQMIWFEDELFVADKNCAYHIKDVMNFAISHEKVLELEKGDIRWHPKFFVSCKVLYLYMHQVIYKWEKNLGFRQIYRIDGFTAWDFVPVGKNKVAFQVRPKFIERGVTEAELTVLDVTTLEEEKFPCHYGYVRSWENNRICVLPNNVTSKMPIIECFDFDTNEKRCLMYGALGSDNVHNIFETSVGTILQGEGKNIYLTTGLWDFMKH